VLTVGSLFAGIGGFDLGLERAGMRCVWQCELDPFCERVLEKHWPDVLRVRDVRDVRAGVVPWVDVICGGFPCQPTSDAGLQLAEGDPRWLWPFFARVVGFLRPRYVIVENVRGLRSRGMGSVLGDLAAMRYDAEWASIRASDVGAPHRRERVWIVAYPDADADGQQGRAEPHRAPLGPGEQAPLWDDAHGLRDPVADTHAIRWARRPRVFGEGWGRELANSRGWRPEPDLARVAHGFPNRVDRVAALGNALVPQIAEWIGRRIIAYEQGRLADAA
jgi:DNA (cytosine-5)-methyltransferase 1